MKFSKEKKIRFQHCDPAGIVFHPRYFEMVNQMIEDWFEYIEFGFFEMTKVGLGIPVVRSECDYINPSRLGEILTFDLWVQHIGQSSFTLILQAASVEEIKIKAKLTLVFVSLLDRGEIKSKPLPAKIRERMLQYLNNAVLIVHY